MKPRGEGERFCEPKLRKALRELGLTGTLALPTAWAYLLFARLVLFLFNLKKVLYE